MLRRIPLLAVTATALVPLGSASAATDRCAGPGRTTLNQTQRIRLFETAQQVSYACDRQTGRSTRLFQRTALVSGQNVRAAGTYDLFTTVTRSRTAGASPQYALAVVDVRTGARRTLSRSRTKIATVASTGVAVWTVAGSGTERLFVSDKRGSRVLDSAAAISSPQIGRSLVVWDDGSGARQSAPVTPF